MQFKVKGSFYLSHFCLNCYITDNFCLFSDNEQTAVHAHLEEDLWSIQIMEESEIYVVEVNCPSLCKIKVLFIAWKICNLRVLFMQRINITMKFGTRFTAFMKAIIEMISERFVSCILVKLNCGKCLSNQPYKSIYIS